MILVQTLQAFVAAATLLLFVWVSTASVTTRGESSGSSGLRRDRRGRPPSPRPERPSAHAGDPAGATSVACWVCGATNERGYSYCRSCVSALPGGGGDLTEIVSPYRRRAN